MTPEIKTNFETSEKITPQKENSENLKPIDYTLSEFSQNKQKAEKQIQQTGEKLGLNVSDKIDMGDKKLLEKLYALFAPLKENLHKLIQKLVASGGSSSQSIGNDRIKVASGGSSSQSIGNGKIEVVSGGSSSQSIGNDRIKVEVASGGSSSQSIGNDRIKDEVASGGSSSQSIGNDRIKIV